MKESQTWFSGWHCRYMFLALQAQAPKYHLLNCFWKEDMLVALLLSIIPYAQPAPGGRSKAKFVSLPEPEPDVPEDRSQPPADVPHSIFEARLIQPMLAVFHLVDCSVCAVFRQYFVEFGEYCEWLICHRLRNDMVDCYQGNKQDWKGASTACRICIRPKPGFPVPKAWRDESRLCV